MTWGGSERLSATACSGKQEGTEAGKGDEIRADTSWHTPRSLWGTCGADRMLSAMSGNGSEMAVGAGGERVAAGG